MRNRVLVAQRRLGLAALFSAAVLAPPAYSETAASASGANATVSSSAATTNASTATNANAGAGFGVTSAATGDNSEGASAGASSQSNVKASATVAANTISLAISSGINSVATSTGAQKDANTQASVTGTTGPATTNVSAQAQASSGPGQLTAAAKASDGSFAYAAIGTINQLQTFVPGGTTKLLHNGYGTESITCNASGTCSNATAGNNAVSASIHFVTSTGMVSAGGVDAILRAVLNVEASAGWSEVFAGASANVAAQSSSKGYGNATSVAGYIQNWSSATVGQASSGSIGKTGNGGGPTVWQATTSSGTATGTVWLSGNTMCVSTRVKLRHNAHAMKAVTKCEHLRTHRDVSNKPTLFKWLTTAFESRNTAEKS